jgi:hypothetical protein
MKLINIMLVIICTTLIITSCGDSGSVTKSITNTITNEPILGKWYPHDSWVDDNNNNTEDTGEWHHMDESYKQDLAKLNMTMEDLSMTYLAEGTGFVTAVKADSTMFSWKTKANNEYINTTTENGETSIMTGSIGEDGILKTMTPQQKNMHTERAVKWTRTP